MNCQTLYSGENKKNIYEVLSAGYLPSMLRVKDKMLSFVNDILVSII